MCLDLGIPLGFAAYVLLFAAATAEATPFIGGFVPGQLLLVASGGLARTGALSAIAVLGVTMAGAIIGDGLGYVAGAKWGRPLLLRYGPRFGVRVAHIKAGELLFEKYGPFAVVVFRFSFVTRAVGPFIAGVSTMRARTFWAMNVLGGILWTAIFFALGYVLGEAYCRFSSVIAPFAIGIGLALAVLITYLLWRRLRVYRDA